MLVDSLKNETEVVEPLNTLFKDEVRLVGKTLNIDQTILEGILFPGQAWA